MSKPTEYICQQCQSQFNATDRGADYVGAGRMPKFCCNACKQKHYRRRKRGAVQAARTKPVPAPTPDPAGDQLPDWFNQWLDKTKS
jgi:hypothetical protein